MIDARIKQYERKVEMILPSDERVNSHFNIERKMAGFRLSILRNERVQQKLMLRLLQVEHKDDP